ncbi:hypothetical protein B0H11DRAFT_1699999 [Mycena galericulata]|nr:hypothetical protein B0H11DRAFT_1699999 [Mycena galericulata]
MRTRSVKESTRSQALHYSWRCFRILILLPISVVMGLGPFFAPVIGVKLAQEQAWLHRCDDFMVEVVLSGLSFSATDDEAPIAMFYFRQPNGILQQGPEYNLTNDPFNASIWNFMLSPGQPLVEGPSITYNVSNSTLDAICPDATSPCTTGSYQPNPNGHLSFSLTNSSTTVNMMAVDKQWVYDQSDDAPSFLLKEVQPNGSLGKVVVRTAVTQPGHCTNLKLCANDASIETLAPVGLTLMKQNEYARVCTTPNSN